MGTGLAVCQHTQCRRTLFFPLLFEMVHAVEIWSHVAAEMEYECAGLRASGQAAELKWAVVRTVDCGGDTDRAVIYEPAGVPIPLTQFLVPGGHLICRVSCSAVQRDSTAP